MVVVVTIMYSVFPSFSDYLSQYNGWMTQSMSNIGPHTVAGVTLAQVRDKYEYESDV